MKWVWFQTVHCKWSSLMPFFLNVDRALYATTLPRALWEKAWHPGIFFMLWILIVIQTAYKIQLFGRISTVLPVKRLVWNTHLARLGAFSPLVCFLWSESVMSWQIQCVSPSPRVISHRKRAKRTIIYQKKKPRERCHPLIGHKSRFLCVCVGRRDRSLLSSGVCRIVQHGSAELASPQNCCNHLGQISSEDNWAKWHVWKHFKAKSHQQSVVLMPCREDTRSTAGYRGRFTPAQRHAHCARVGLRLECVHATKTIPRPPLQRGLRKAIFLVHTWVRLLLFTLAQTNLTCA